MSLKFGTARACPTCGSTVDAEQYNDSEIIPATLSVRLRCRTHCNKEELQSLMLTMVEAKRQPTDSLYEGKAECTS